MKRSLAKSIKPKTRTIEDSPAKRKHPLKVDVQETLAWLKGRGTKQNRDSMAPRYGIIASKAFGVSMANIQKLARELGRNHDLAAALWDTGWYEARMLASLVDDPARVTPAQMDRWVKDFDNWGICDTVCFFLFDRTPQAFHKVEQWAGRREEFAKRAAFALLACLALHDKTTGDEAFAQCLPLIENAADDDRNFVKKSVNWALRAIGERSEELHTAAVKLARRLADSPQAAARWVGKDALRQLSSPAVLRRLAKRSLAVSRH